MIKIKIFLSINRQRASLFVIDRVLKNSWMSDNRIIRHKLFIHNFSCFLKPSPRLRVTRPEGIEDLLRSMTSSSNPEMNAKVIALSTPACASSAMIKMETLSGKW